MPRVSRPSDTRRHGKWPVREDPLRQEDQSPRNLPLCLQDLRDSDSLGIRHDESLLTKGDERIDSRGSQRRDAARDERRDNE